MTPLDEQLFDHFGEREQGHHHRGFGPLADDDRSGDGRHHQEIDVE